MKKIILGAILLFSMFSCENATSPSQDTEMLQKKYPNSSVFRVSLYKYIIADSLHTYSIDVTYDGKIYSTIKIR